MSDQEQSVMEFPCRFPIKAMGLDCAEFHASVMEIIQRHAPNTPREGFNHRTSNKGKYLSITITVEATSREQLDAIYQDLTDSAHVLMAL